MNILYLAFIRIPTEKAHGVQIMKTCEALVAQGADVELVVPGRKTSISEESFSFYGVEKTFILTKLGGPDFVKWGLFGFLFSALWFSEKARFQKKFLRADIIYSRDALILLQYILLGKRLVYEAHTKPTWISTLVAKHSYKLVVISEGLRDAYIAQGVNRKKIIIAHDAIDPESFQKQFSKEEAQNWLGIPHDKKVALYVGRIDAAKGADTFAAASDYVANDTICVLVGSGPLEKTLQKKYSKALFLRETPYRELPRVLASADILILPNSQKDENASLYTSPLKAFAYLATEKPILASRVKSLESILKKEATYFLPDDPRSLAECLKGLGGFSRVPLRYTWGERAQTVLNAITDYVQKDNKVPSRSIS